MRAQEPIRTVSYVQLADGRTAVFGTSNADSFPPYPFTEQERREIGRRLTVLYLNELCRGKAEFYTDDKEAGNEV